jgi:hypothetical protein
VRIAALSTLLAVAALGCHKPRSEPDRATPPAAPLTSTLGVPSAPCGLDPCRVTAGRAIAAHGDTLYVLDSVGVLALPIAGGTPRRLAHVTGAKIAADGQAVYVARHGMLGQQQGATITRVSVKDGSATTIASGIDDPWELAADATHLYWLSPKLGSEAVWRAPLASGRAESFVSRSGLVHPVLRANDVLFVENVSGRLWSAPKSGGAPRSLATVGKATWLASDEHSVYFVRPSWSSEVLSLDGPGGEPKLLAKLDCMCTELVLAGRRLLAACGTEGRVIVVPLDGKPVVSECTATRNPLMAPCAVDALGCRTRMRRAPATRESDLAP